MNSTCPSCGITYRIDPAKIPSGGIRARCTRCDGVFRITPRAISETASAAPAPPAEPPQPSPEPEPPPSAAQEQAPEPEPAPEPDSAPQSSSPAAGTRAGSPFGVVDPHQQARRLARALVSDIVVYHPDRREQSLAEGTLRQDFRDEIRKSWDEYVARVGDQIARQTTYFRDALNEILAGGGSVF